MRGQRAGAHAALVATTVHLRLDPNPGLASHEQGTNALRPVGLVGGQTHQVNRQASQVDLNAAGGLCGIDMKHNALFTANGAKGSDVLNDTDFVVHKHHAGQDGVGTDRGLEHRQVDQAVSLHVQVADLEALALKFAAGIEHSLVLGLDGNDVPAFGLVEAGCTLDREVVGLGGTRGPDDFSRIGADQCSDLFARLFHSGLGFPSPGVAARSGVAKMLTQPGNHGVHHPLIAGIGGTVVHVNRKVRGRVHDENAVRKIRSC